jgi:hypothetical protein
MIRNSPDTPMARGIIPRVQRLAQRQLAMLIGTAMNPRRVPLRELRARNAAGDGRTLKPDKGFGAVLPAD